MKKNIKIAVIGGTGKSGKYIVRQLLDQGFPLKVLVRNPEKFQIQNPLIEVVHGDVQDEAIVRYLLKDCEAIVSALGVGIPPSSPTIFSQATRNILQAMEARGVRRYILLTGLNVDVAGDKKSSRTTAATDWMYTNYPESTADRQLEYRLLSESNSDWTLVRLPMIKQSETRSKVDISLIDCPGEQIGATDLAHFIICELTELSYIRLAPFLANA